MIQSSAFDYVNVLDKAADASWLRETVISNNMANVDTPGYKRQDVDFQSLLKEQLQKNSSSNSLDQEINNTNLSRLTATAHTDSAAASYSYRLDGNNVDVDTEQVELASEQIRYSALTDSMTQEFSRLKSVMTS